METPEVRTERLDHLGIVAGVCREIGLIEEIDRIVGPTERKVSVGQATQAMVLNALGFVGRALYLTPEYFANKPVELLIGEGITAADLNDDCLGRALDKLYEKGVTEVYAQVASRGLQVYGIEHQELHLDSSSFSLFGEYKPPAAEAESKGEEAAEKPAPAVITVTQGYSKDHRPDLKQAVLNLICTHQAALPVWLEALSGNSQDKTSFPTTIQAYLDQMKAGAETFFIIDSALYTAGNIGKLDGKCRWLTRVPKTLAGAQELLGAIPREQMEEWGNGYWGTEVGSLYGGVKQRWVLVFSQQAWEREQKSWKKRLRKAEQQAQKQWQALARREWKSEDEARRAVAQAEKKWRYHRADYKVQAVPHYEKKGRPKADQTPAWTGWQVVGQVVADAAAVTTEEKQQGKFILATNDLEAERLPAPQMLEGYKEQGTTVERGFRFLKDPAFFASGLYVQKPQRLMATLMIMGLALLIYALAEHQVRQTLQQRNETVPNQVGKATARPTLRRLFQVFEGIDILVEQGPQGVTRRVLNLRPQHRQILALFGPAVQQCYLWDPVERAPTTPPDPEDGSPGAKSHFDDG